MRFFRSIVLGAFILGVLGCASKLQVFDASKNPGEVKGIRVHQNIPYILTKNVETEKCPPRIEESIVHLAVGSPYDINFEPAQFGKAEFTVIFADEGALKQVTLNSTPQVAETIKSLADLTEQVSKFAGAARTSAPNCGGVKNETIIGAR